MAPRVVLAGHNVDREALQRRLTGQDAAAAGALSPETLSAAYARISRDPRDVPELRADARREVDRARRSNRAIIFQMGHASVAEHACFNLDVMDLSRLAVEALEHHRLASYTEKSQRYIRLEGDYAVPPELAGGPLERELHALVARLAETYGELAAALTERAAAEAPEARRAAVEARANEDARYVLPLCATAQLGMTVNARTLETMIARCGSHPLAEVRALGAALYQAVAEQAASVVRYTEPTPYLRDADPALAARAAACLPPDPGRPPPAVRLVASTPEADRQVVAGLLHAAGSCDFETCWNTAGALAPERTDALLAEIFGRMQPWDQLPRAFELVQFTFELVLSAACFGQLKRHRMATLTSQAYAPALGRTVPDAIVDGGLQGPFDEALDAAETLYRKIAAHRPEAAPYALTNAHRRRVLFAINGRALGHFARLRCDAEAQWDIRRLGAAMVEQVQQLMPRAGAFYGGKDCFADLRTGLGLGEDAAG